MSDACATKLFFNPVSRRFLAESKFKVYTHHFSQFVRSVSNTGVKESEYAYTHWMPPGFKEGLNDYSVCGGLLRDFYKIRAKDTDPNWALNDMIWEVNCAREAYFDGFAVDQISAGPALIPSGQYIKYRRIMDAIDAVGDPTFKFYAQPDGNGSASKNPVQLAADLAEVAGHPSALFTPDGALDVTPYGPEFATKSGMTALAFWTAVRANALQTFKLRLSYNFCYSKSWLDPVGGAPALDVIADGHGRWGLRNPKDIVARTNTAADAAEWCHKDYDKPWTAAVAVGDERPKSGTYHENRGFSALRESWRVACGLVTGVKADNVLNPTWNDLAEHAHTAPTENHGYVYCDLNAYYIHFYKTGMWPPTETDCIFISHRVQFTDGTKYTGTQTKFMTVIGGTPVYDEVEFLLAVKEPCILETTVGGSVLTRVIDQADIDSSWDRLVSIKLPLALGSISARLMRNGETVAYIASPWEVVKELVSQDMNYRTCSSLRGV